MRSRFNKWVLLALMAVSLLAPSNAGAVQVFPGEGLTFSQVDLTYPGATQMDSRYGMVAADFDALTAATGIGIGYLNIVTAEGWVVRNMPVDTSSGYPGLSTMFDLGGPGDISSLLVYADLSVTSAITFSATPNTTVGVGTTEENAQGVGDPLTSPPSAPIDAGLIIFDPLGLIDAIWQLFNPNIEQDKNQCAPAALANSFQWLEDTYDGINITPEHRPGIRDNSLVGELDKAMGRPAHSRPPSHKSVLDAKLKFIEDNDLEDDLDCKHKNRPGTNLLPNNNVPGPGGEATSMVNNDQTLSLAEWIIAEIEAGEDVEVVIRGGNHMVRVSGAGHTGGVPWITFIHDAKQGFDDKGTPGVDDDETANNGGTGLFDGGRAHSNVVNDRLVNLPGMPTLDYAMSESPKECEPTGIIRDNTDGFVPVDGDPRGSKWHELAPDYCEPWTLTSWISKDGYLNYCDIVDFTHDVTGVISWEHVERVMPTITVTKVTYPEDLIYLDMMDENPMVDPITDPVGTYWKEVYPEYCREFELEWWDDNGNGYLDYCDYIGLHAVNGPDSCTTEVYHVEDVSTDLETTPITPCVCPDSTEVLPGHNATIHLNMCNVPEIGGFDFVVKYDPSGLNFLSAKPLGEVAEWEYFTYRYSEQDNCGGGCPTGYIRVIGIADMPDGATPDEAIFQPEGHFVELTFGTTEDLSFIGQCFHIDWGWFDCGDNTMSSRSGDILYLADDIEEILPDEDCLAGDKGYTPIPVIDFCHGIICIIPPPDDRGDINMNGVANEIADAVLFANYFIYGPSVWDPVFYENQILATDVNDDGIPLTVADLVYLIRIITGDANPYPESGEGGKITPGHLMAAVDWRIVGDHMAVDFTNESDAGAILLAFDHHGAEFGEPVLSDRASAMTMISHNNGAQLRVLLYGLEPGANIPAGEGAILTIPITTPDPGLVLAEVEAADYYGNMMTVESTRPTYVPKEFALFQNIPNPFNATTRIDFNLPEAGEVTLAVYDVLGRKVATLVDGHLEPGAHHITWNSRDEHGAEVASGVYFYRITTDKHQTSRKMVLVK